MELEDIKRLVLRADPNARHYDGGQSTGSYTTWQERARLGFSAGDRQAGGWRFTIDRFFDLSEPEEFDPVAERIEEVLEDAPDVAYTREVIDESREGYIHNVFTCEGM